MGTTNLSARGSPKVRSQSLSLSHLVECDRNIALHPRLRCLPRPEGSLYERQSRRDASILQALHRTRYTVHLRVPAQKAWTPQPVRPHKTSSVETQIYLDRIDCVSGATATSAGFRRQQQPSKPNIYLQQMERNLNSSLPQSPRPLPRLLRPLGPKGPPKVHLGRGRPPAQRQRPPTLPMGTSNTL